MFGKKKEINEAGGPSEKSDKKVNAPLSADKIRTSRSNTDKSHRLSADVSGNVPLLSNVLTHVVEDHIIAGPHGALQQATTGAPDRWSFGSTKIVYWDSISNIDTPVDFETAIAETGHGCFQWKLLFACGLIYSCCSLSTTTLSLVLPAAQYDFSLDSMDKGVLNTAPLWGMVIGGYIWGNFADNKGRKFVLFWTLTIDSFFAYLSSFSQRYEFFYMCRIMNGFAIIGSTSIVFAYMGEFLDHKHRDIFLTYLELFWTMGIIALPLIGLVIIPLQFSFGERGVFLFNSWRLFVFVCGVPSTIGAIIISRMSESPRFLMLMGELEKTTKILERMYTSNTGQPKENFSVKVLREPEDQNALERSDTTNRSCWKRFKSLMKDIYRQHKQLFSGRSLFNIIITCYVDFGLISVYYTMMLWVPELLNRLENHVQQFGVHPTLCEVSSVETNDEPVDSMIKTETFVHTIITCLACIPTTLLLLCLIKWVNKKALLVGIMWSAAIPAVCLAYVNTIFQVVTMLSVLKSLTNLAEAILFCAIVEIFPINTRGTALSLTVIIGRVGSIVGNVVFGLMIDRHCKELFYLMGCNLVLSGIVCLFLPKMQKGH